MYANHYKRAHGNHSIEINAVCLSTEVEISGLGMTESDVGGRDANTILK